MMFQAFFSPTLFSVLYSSRPSFRSFLAFSFTCQGEAGRQDSWDQDATSPGQLELLAALFQTGGGPWGWAPLAQRGRVLGQGEFTLSALLCTHRLPGELNPSGQGCNTQRQQDQPHM